MPSYSRTSWFVSLFIHLLILVVLFFIYLPTITQQEFVEVFWGSAESQEVQPTSASATSGGDESTAGTASSLEQPRTAVVLPERRLPDLSNEIFPTVKTEKLENSVLEEKQSQQTAPPIENDRQDKKLSLAQGQGDKVSPLGTGVSGRSGGEAATSRGVEYSLEWSGGGTRTKISGRLPRYPDGVNVSAQISLQVVVEPNGKVRSVLPLQKAHPLFEQSAIEEVRLWRFEPLATQFPQVDQTCVVTFYFLAK